MFGPLTFQTEASTSSSVPKCKIGSETDNDDDDLESVPCLLCSKDFLFPNEKEICLSHLLKDHNFIISDEHLIADLGRYIKFWKERFIGSGDFKRFCSVLVANPGKKIYSPYPEGQLFYLLSDIEDIDKELRDRLRKERVENVLKQQKLEREDKNFYHECLFCRQSLGPTRNDFLSHLATQHNLQLGKPSNLVYVDKLIAIIEEKMNNLQCVYCEKFFKDRSVLKEHMRKKGHKRVNPSNEMYDKFYVINHIEPDKSWKEREKLRKKKKSQSGSSTGDGDDDDDDSEEDCDWSDWEEDIKQPIVCLFCELILPNWETTLAHMKNQHLFDYEVHSIGLNFYEQIKFVNYIRRQVFRNRCFFCDAEHPTRNMLLDHLNTYRHVKMPERNLWNQPEFYFPTYENDAFLCQIEDKKEEENSNIADALAEIKILTDKALPSEGEETMLCDSKGLPSGGDETMLCDSKALPSGSDETMMCDSKALPSGGDETMMCDN